MCFRRAVCAIVEGYSGGSDADGCANAAVVGSEGDGKERSAGGLIGLLA